MSTAVLMSRIADRFLLMLEFDRDNGTRQQYSLTSGPTHIFLNEDLCPHLILATATSALCATAPHTRALMVVSCMYVCFRLRAHRCILLPGSPICEPIWLLMILYGRCALLVLLGAGGPVYARAYMVPCGSFQCVAGLGRPGMRAYMVTYSARQAG